jgi:hypothetical protein
MLTKLMIVGAFLFALHPPHAHANDYGYNEAYQSNLRNERQLEQYRIENELHQQSRKLDEIQRGLNDRDMGDDGDDD